jgi:hypothetical protein
LANVLKLNNMELSDCPRSASRAENRHPRALWFRDRAKRRQKSLSVGVFSDETVAASDYTIHRADERSGLPKLVEMLDDGLLVGQRAVESDPPHR